jgi:hypothetical protein
VLLAALGPLAVVALTPVAAIDFWWDFWMGLGFASLAGFALLPVLSARWWAARHPQAATLLLIQRLHRDLAWWLTALALAHVLGVLWLVNPWLGLAACAAWLLVALLLRYSSAASITAAVVSPFVQAAIGGVDAVLASIALMALLLVLRHRQNIANLIAGKERKIGAKATPGKG